MKHGKRSRFRTRVEAVRYLEERATENPVTGQRPLRVYRCSACSWWHVTSKPLKKRGNNGNV